MAKCKVMIVDDNRQNRIIASGFLEDEYNVMELESGDACLKHLPDFKPDIILLDWMMPAPDGIETLRIIREKMPEYRNVRIVMLTAKAQPEDIVKAWRAGADDYIVKPFDMTNMLAIMDQQFLEKQRLDQHEQELKEMEAQLQQTQKMEAVGVLAGGIAHDFNNILFPILGYCELTLSAYEISDEVKCNLEEIQKAGKRAQALVKQILSFSRQKNQEAQPVAIGMIVKEALKLLQPAFPANIQFNVNIDPKCGLVFADPTQIHQIIMNLCTNAKHAMEQSGGTLSIHLFPLPSSQSPDPAQSDFSNASDYLALEIRDTGCGIPSDLLSKIFTPFFTTKEMGKGTGMGLSVVQGIVNKMGGKLTVKSEVGKGSHFSIHLPLHHETKELKAPENTLSPLKGGTETILLADDEPAILDMLEKTLMQLGYAVHSFTSSTRLLDHFHAHGADLLITDFSMPEMTGVELAERIWNTHPAFPVILMTGFSENLSKEKALELGIRRYLMKPILLHELTNAIRSIFDTPSAEKIL